MQRAGVKIVVVTDAVLDAISPVNTPSGIVGIARRPDARLEDFFKKEPQLIAMLHDVQDPGNVGAVVRAAEGCGATGVICSDGTADPFGWKALRGAMGSAFRLPVAARQPLAEAIAMARAKGLRVFATTDAGGVVAVYEAVNAQAVAHEGESDPDRACPECGCPRRPGRTLEDPEMQQSHKINGLVAAVIAYSRAARAPAKRTVAFAWA